MTRYVEREVVRFILPIHKDIKVLRPEQVILQYGERGYSVDVGARCYLSRSNSDSRKRSGSLFVDPTSLNSARVEKIQQLISHINYEAEMGTKKLVSISKVTSDFVRYIDWCDSNGHSHVLTDESGARSAYKAYLMHLKERVQQDALSVNTAAKYQRHSLEILSELMDAPELHQGLNLLHRNHQAIETTSPPDEEAQGKVLSLCEYLFKGISPLVLEGMPYPFKLRVPAYLGWEDNHLWIFPALKRFMAPHEIQRRESLKSTNWCIDYANGKIAHFADIERYYENKYVAQEGIERSTKQIEAANKDSRHYRRLQIAMFAHNIFVLQFITATGMNWAQVCELPWSQNYEIAVESQGFRAIKYRAHGRKIIFTIQISFLPQFKRFLELRTYLLDQKTSNFLFFTLGPNLVSEPTMIGRDLLQSVFRTLVTIDPFLPKLLPRNWRAGKGDFLMRTNDLSTTAAVLQNTEGTVLRHYATGSETLAIEEMSGFFEKLSEKILYKAEPLPAGGIKNPLGGCLSYHAPSRFEDDTPVEPDCRQPEGCLFCDKYILHADEQDIRKILSCRYCIYQTQHLSASADHFQQLFEPIIDRINLMLDHINGLSSIHASMVDRITHEVEDEGILDRYWQGKMEMLVALGLVIQ